MKNYDGLRKNAFQAITQALLTTQTILTVSTFSSNSLLYSDIYCKCIVNKNVKTNGSLDTLNSKKDLRQADTVRKHFKKFDIFTEEIVAVSDSQDECITDLDRILQFCGI